MIVLVVHETFQVIHIGIFIEQCTLLNAKWLSLTGILLLY